MVKNSECPQLSLSVMKNAKHSCWKNAPQDVIILMMYSWTKCANRIGSVYIYIKYIVNSIHNTLYSLYCNSDLGEVSTQYTLFKE
jgi:hypothetical protein